MSNYTKATNFAIKDGLVTTDPAKIIKGTDIDNEFNAISSAISSKADLNSPAFTGTPTASTATTGTNTTQLATTAFVQTAINAAFPGIIVMWSGTIASIPAAWYLCDGNNGTPDLRDRFIIGASADNGGYAKTNVTAAYTQTGGTKDAIVVSHTHTATSTSTVTDPQHSHGITTWNYGDSGTSRTKWDSGETSATTSTNSASTGITVATSTTVASAGSSGTNANLPPYYALAFIMKA